MHLNLSSLNILQTGFYIFRAGKVIDSSDGGVIEVCSLQLDDQSWILDSVGKTEAWCEYPVWTSMWTQIRIIHGLCESTAYSMNCYETLKILLCGFFSAKGVGISPFLMKFFRDQSCTLSARGGWVPTISATFLDKRNSAKGEGSHHYCA